MSSKGMEKLSYSPLTDPGRAAPREHYRRHGANFPSHARRALSLLNQDSSSAQGVDPLSTMCVASNRAQTPRCCSCPWVKHTQTIISAPKHSAGDGEVLSRCPLNALWLPLPASHPAAAAQELSALLPTSSKVGRCKVWYDAISGDFFGYYFFSTCYVEKK